MSNNNKIWDFVGEEKALDAINIKLKEKLTPIVSFDLDINDEEIIEIYKRRWDIEQG